MRIKKIINACIVILIYPVGYACGFIEGAIDIIKGKD